MQKLIGIDTTANELELTLIKKRSYKLIPFGRFNLKWDCSKAVAKRKNNISIKEILDSYVQASGMPYTKEQYDNIVFFMKKNKTEFLIDVESRFIYTIIGNQLCSISHQKLTAYKHYLSEFGLIDNIETWTLYISN